MPHPAKPASRAELDAVAPAGLHALLDPLRGILDEAGRLAFSMFRQNVRAWSKDNQSPVSDADLAVDGFLRERLGALEPDAGWLSEETADAPQRLSRRRLWIVDPIDGTRSFLAGREDWAVCVALVENGEPVLGALALPATGETFLATRGGGAFRNGQPIAARPVHAIETARVVRPAAFNAQVKAAGFPIEVPRIHSIAVRLARVASGEIDAAIIGPHANDWDLAAADLIVRESGARISDADGREPVYNRAIPKHGALVASGVDLHPALLAALAASMR
jgi:myo-inositol-1(or 4)-monophosphatase